MDNILFSSKSNEWYTPIDFFNELNKLYNFDLDPCTTPENPLNLPNFYTIYDDGLEKSWAGHRVFCNPPYGKDIYKWVEKCYYEWLLNKTFIVLLIPVRTDTKYFHNYIYHKCHIRFLKGRLHFSGSKNVAPFPSMLCIYGL